MKINGILQLRILKYRDDLRSYTLYVRNISSYESKACSHVLCDTGVHAWLSTFTTPLQYNT